MFNSLPLGTVSKSVHFRATSNQMLGYQPSHGSCGLVRSLSGSA